jgi:diacylglycerol kinase family enzyme
LTVRWLAIANPHAGAFRFGAFAARWMPRIEAAVEHVAYTQGPGHATELARAAGDYDGIVVIGGDGTLFETLAGSTRPGQLHAVIPAGRGNCLALDLGVGTVPAALAVIRDGAPVQIDVMALELELADGTRRACRVLSTLAAGYVADCVARAARLAWLGRGAYAVSAVLTRPRRFVLHARYGAEPAGSERLRSVIVNNTRHLANFQAFPRASFGDGLLDVLELDAPWGRQMLHNVSVLSRGHFYNPGRERQAAEMELRFESPQLMMIDGELVHDVLGCRVRAERAAVRFLRRAQA